MTKSKADVVKSSNFEFELGQLLSRDKSVQKLLLLEKKRRGLEPKELVFVYVSDYARSSWNMVDAVQSSLANEINAFKSYIKDRCCRAYELGYIKKLPNLGKKLLSVGDEIKISDIEQLLKKKEKRMKRSTLYVERNLGRKNDLREFWKDGCIKTTDSCKNGTMAEDVFSEKWKYPTIQWNFQWDRFVFIGIPDGITTQFVYEFKWTQHQSRFETSKQRAELQAGAYGYLFCRPKIRIQVKVGDDDLEPHTWEMEIDHCAVEKSFRSFRVASDR